MAQPAVFFDRDGTLIEEVHYLNRTDQVRVVEGVAGMLNELETAGYRRIIVTNQAAIGKGLLTVQGLHEIQARLDELLEQQGASLDGWYFCPEVRQSAGDETIDHPNRKPAPGMLLQAAEDFDIDLSSSWMVGDRLSDALAGKNAGCLGSILIEAGHFNEADRDHPAVDHVVSHVSEITPIILRQQV